MPSIPIEGYATSVLLQPDGRIVLAGMSFTNHGPNQFTAVRVNPNGTLDSGFSGDGKVAVQSQGTDDAAFAAALQADGKILLAGQLYDPVAEKYDFGVVRLDTHGNLDTSFSGDGQTSIPVGPEVDSALGVAVQADGKIILVGESDVRVGDNYVLDGSVVRLNADGSLDTTFSGDGKVLNPMGTDNNASDSVVVQADGKILVAGQSPDANGQLSFSIFRLNTDGSVDNTFSGDGKAIFSIGTRDSGANCMVVQPDGKIILGGYCYVDSDLHTDFALIRLNSDGTLDTSFADGGHAIIQVSPYINNLTSLALQADGRIVAAGTCQDNPGSYLYSSFFRFNADGTLDTTFSRDGKMTRESVAYGVVVQPDGRIVAGGRSSGPGGGDFSVVRLNADGSSDMSLPDASQKGTSGDDTLVGGYGTNSINGEGGNDTIHGGTDSDLIHGGDGADRIDGGAGTDYLYGDAGDDVLHGGAATNDPPNQLWGGTGNDTYYVDNIGDLVVEAANGGTDQVFSSVGYTLSQFVENLTLTGTGNINGTGNSLANVLTGNSGNNILNGKDGADTMKGGAGNDTYYVDHPRDTVIEASGEGTDQVFSSIGYSLSQFVENLTLTGTTKINMNGNALANKLVGNSSNNIIDGMAGADVMTGGAGNDTYRVDNAGDSVVEANNGGTDQVLSSVSYALRPFVENLTLTGTKKTNTDGNALGNTLIGNARNNVFDGMAGADVMTGGGGADTFGFTTSLVAGNVDTITDFTVGADKIRLTHSIFNAIAGIGALSAGQFTANASGTAQDANDRIIYETDTGKLFYDSNGSAAGGATQFATLSPGLGLSNANFFVI
jgi:uncharacterized delta-60 repeat protein